MTSILWINYFNFSTYKDELKFIYKILSASDAKMYEKIFFDALLVLKMRIVLSVLGKVPSILNFQLHIGACDADSKRWRLFVFPLFFDFVNSIEKKSRLNCMYNLNKLFDSNCKLHRKCDVQFTYYDYKLNSIQSYHKVIHELQKCIEYLK